MERRIVRTPSSSKWMFECETIKLELSWRFFLASFSICVRKTFHSCHFKWKCCGMRDYHFREWFAWCTNETPASGLLETLIYCELLCPAATKTNHFEWKTGLEEWERERAKRRESDNLYSVNEWVDIHFVCFASGQISKIQSGKWTLSIVPEWI